MYEWKNGISGLGWTVRWTDRQPENIVPPVPKGECITKTERDILLHIIATGHIAGMNDLICCTNMDYFHQHG